MASDEEITNALADESYKRLTIERVEGYEENATSYEVHTDDSMVFILSKEYGVVPEAGQTMQMWTMNYSMIRGVAINNQLCFFRTEAQQRAKLEQENEERSRKRREDFENDVDGQRSKLIRSIKSLPPVFQNRIHKFTDTNENFLWEFGSYEVMCCVDAVKVADWVWLNYPNDVETGFAESTKHEKDIGIDTGHSGNSYSVVRVLAWDYLTDETLVEKEHGALSPLVGCEEYGCPHPLSTTGTSH